MKILIFLLLFTGVLITAQNKFQIKIDLLNNSTDLQSIEFKTDDFTFVIDSLGKLQDFFENSNDNGEIDYYTDVVFDKGKYGKLKSIGANKYNYWDDENFDKGKFGKLKFINNIKIDYWDDQNFDGLKFGKIKKIGSATFDYWNDSNFDGLKYGKFKKIENFTVDYWDSKTFDGKKYGNLKSIGAVKFNYWDEISTAIKSGKLKSISGSESNLSIIYN